MDSINRSTLSSAAQTAVGSRPLYRLTARAGGNNITSFNGGTVSVEVPYTLAWGENQNSIIVYRLNEITGDMSVVRSYFNAATGRVRFAVSSFSVYVIGHASPLTFADAATINAHVPAELRDNITFVSTRRLFTGHSSGALSGMFEPFGTITRAQFVTVLANYDGVNLNQSKYGSTSFTDSRGAWYTAAISWGEEMKLFGGLSVSFRPDEPLNRADMALWFYNYLTNSNTRIEPVRSMAFSDISALSAEHRTAILALANAGIINGIDGFSGGRFGTDGTSERVNVAAIVARAVRAFTV
jgi:hypothetical protein